MEFEVKLADTGHSVSVTLDKNARGENLFLQVQYQLKTPLEQQFLLTKTGGRITSEVLLQKILIEDAGNSTIVSKEDSKFSTERKACLYLYNIKEMNKSVEPMRQNFRALKKEELKEQLKRYKRLRPNIICFESLQNIYSKEVLESYPKAYEIIHHMKKYYRQLSDEYVEMKQIFGKIRDLGEVCENQRKSVKTLLSYIIIQGQHLKKNGQKLLSLKNNLRDKFSGEDGNLQKNSKFFENKKEQDQILSYHEQKISDMRSRIQATLYEIKNSARSKQEQLKKCQKAIMLFEDKKYDEIIEQKISRCVKEYNATLNYFKSYVQSQDEKYMSFIEDASENLNRFASSNQLENTYSELYQCLLNHFCQIKEFKQKNIEIVRSKFRDTIKYENLILTWERQIEEEKKLLLADLNKNQHKVMKQQSFTEKNSLDDKSQPKVESQKSLQSFKSSIKTEAEVKRRVKFYKKLTYIQSLAFKMCNEEEQLRKKYVNQSKKGKENSKELLRNIKTPILEIDTDGTTDLELKKMNREVLLTQEDMGCEDFMLIQYNEMLEIIKNQLGKEKNTKIKNLQQLLTLSTSVFKKIYERNEQKADVKSSKLIEQKEELSLKINQLEQKCSNFKAQITQYQKSVEMLHATISQKEQYANTIQKTKIQELSKERNKYEKIVTDKKQLQSDLKTQITLMEQFSNQFQTTYEELENEKQLNSQLKQLLAKKQLEIIRLEEALNDKTSKMGIQSIIYDPNQKQISDQNELKEVVLQNLGEKVHEDPNETINKLKDENERLKRENEALQAENQMLQEDLRATSDQLNKLILKVTEDVEVQVDIHQQTMGFKHDQKNIITVTQDISIGQNVIFMPFSNNLYVGVSNKDQDRTLCNMNGVHQSNYILNVESFSPKTRQLLSECSFLVILKVEHLNKSGNNFNVEGKIQYLFGFQDDNVAIKNYVPYLG